MAYQFHGVKVLIVEDNLPMQNIVRSLLTTFGVGTILTAKNGEEGMIMLKKHNPDLVIADWMMKPIDGITFTKELRNSHDVPNPYVPVVLMTGFSEKRRVIQARDAGVTEFLVKPFTAKDLYKRIVQIIERPRQFVRSPDFFGPDRRRTFSKNYDGPMRRDEDVEVKKNAKHKLQASKTLSRMRERANITKHYEFNKEDIEMVDRNDL